MHHLLQAGTTQKLQELRTIQSALEAARETVKVLALQEQLALQAVATLETNLGPFARKTCPDDILNYIFREIHWQWQEDDPFWVHLGDIAFNFDRAKAPFHLAAVSSKWRKVALEITRIWNYVGVPDTLREGARDIWEGYLHTVLSRCGETPITVVVDSSKPITEELLQPLLQRVEKWDKAYLMYPLSSGDIVGTALCSPTPCLRELSVAAKRLSFSDFAGSKRYMLPHAPLLHEFCTFRSLIWNGDLPPLNLTKLTLHSLALAMPELFEILSRCPRIQELDMLLDLDIDTASPTSTVTLPHLHTMRVYNDNFDIDETPIQFLLPAMQRQLTTPKLDCLEIPAVKGLGPTFEMMAANLVKLELRDLAEPINDHDAAVVGLLKGLRTLTFYGGQIGDSFFTHLINRRPWLLPSLDTLTLTQDAEVIPSNGGSVYAFVLARRQARRDGEKSEQTLVTGVTTVNIDTESLKSYVPLINNI